jgi:hypothetical protein
VRYSIRKQDHDIRKGVATITLEVRAHVAAADIAESSTFLWLKTPEIQSEDEVIRNDLETLEMLGSLFISGTRVLGARTME